MSTAAAHRGPQYDYLHTATATPSWWARVRGTQYPAAYRARSSSATTRPASQRLTLGGSGQVASSSRFDRPGGLWTSRPLPTAILPFRDFQGAPIKSLVVYSPVESLAGRGLNGHADQRPRAAGGAVHARARGPRRRPALLRLGLRRRHAAQLACATPRTPTLSGASTRAPDRERRSRAVDTETVSISVGRIPPPRTSRAGGRVPVPRRADDPVAGFGHRYGGRHSSPPRPTGGRSASSTSATRTSSPTSPATRAPPSARRRITTPTPITR